jgi:hypothetical protein
LALSKKILENDHATSRDHLRLEKSVRMLRLLQLLQLLCVALRASRASAQSK